MRHAIILLISGLSLHAQQGGMEGTVIDSATRRPLPGVHIMSFDLGSAVASQSMSGEAYGALSGKDGRFSIGKLKPGTYMLAPQLAGYAYVPGKAGEAWSTMTVAVKAAETRTGVQIEMTPEAFFSGRVTDENGDPLQKVTVAASAAGDAAQPMGGPMPVQTDERGRYRIRGAPGKYLVQVTPPREMFSTPEIRSDGSIPVVRGAIWYPGALEKSAASMVEIFAGKETPGIDIRMAAQRGVSLHGVVAGAPAGGGGTNVQIVSAGGTQQQQVMGSRYARVDSDGKFAFTGLTPGAYTVWARFDGQGISLRSGFEPLHLDSGDDNTISLRLLAGEELAATLEGAGNSKEKRAIALDSVSPVQQMFGSKVTGTAAPDGTYRIAGVFPGKYRVKVTPAPDGVYVKSVRLDSAEAADGVVDLSQGVRGARLKVIYGGNAGAIEGRVLDPEGKPSRIPFTLVTLVDSAGELDQENLKRVGAGEKFSFTNLHPGRYRLAVTDPMLINSTESVKAEALKAPLIEIAEGDRITRDLTVAAAGKGAARVQ